MNYETFKKAIIKRLEYEIPNPKTVSIQSVSKNNGLNLDGLVIMESGRNISPTLYLNYYYDSYLSGTSFQQIYETILKNYEDNKPSQNIDIRFFTDFNNVSQKIAFKIIHYDRNKKLLDTVPHIHYLDLAIVFFCLIELKEAQGSATILIHQSHINYWGVTVRELFDLAQTNVPKLLEPAFYNMNDILGDLSGQNCLLPDTVPDSPYPMFVLTNHLKLYGAGCMIYENLLKKYAQKFNTDFYILPSSVHEVLLVPADEKKCLKDLSDMVKEVNETLSEEDILSDHAYYYSRKTNDISM